ncbi:hypothetical protein C8J56DRAFT_1125071 [Mycena floridula]|nr:hypothetical protein C8J56DRAFT_1125071 [Mycena floridula]
MLLTLYLSSRAGQSPSAGDTSCHHRGLFDIILGSFSTIFACTWVSVHPNVPPPGQGFVKRLFRRLAMMLVAIIAPEIVVFFAARQFMFAREFAKGMFNALSAGSQLNVSAEFGLSKTHGFFFSMGGFVSCQRMPITTRSQLRLNPEYLQEMRDVTEEEIKDKSKGDALSKSFALLQVIWFITQCIGRHIQQLPLVTLEIATLAFAVLNIFMWLLWWNKPLGVDIPIAIGRGWQPPSVGSTDNTGQPNWLDTIIHGPLLGEYPSYSVYDSTYVPVFWCPNLKESYHFAVIHFECVTGIVFGAIHCLGWNAKFPSTTESMAWKVAALFITGFMGGSLYLILMAEVQFEWWDKAANVSRGVWVYVGVPLYIIARLFLLVLPLTSLRDLPAGVFQNVDWTSYMPHL